MSISTNVNRWNPPRLRPGRFCVIILENMAKNLKIAFVIDGFNLYHSISDSQKANGGVCSKWFDMDSFCKSYLVPIGIKFDAKVALESIHYFSALATHLAEKDPEKIIRHKDYISCLEFMGINVHLGRFKKKNVKYSNNKVRVCLQTHEEKETDVAIAVKAFELFHQDSIDILAIVSGDSDIVPAVKAIKLNFPEKIVVSIFPAGRKSDDMEKNVHASFKASNAKYLQHHLPDPFILKNLQISKPVGW